MIVMEMENVIKVIINVIAPKIFGEMIAVRKLVLINVQ